MSETTVVNAAFAAAAGSRAVRGTTHHAVAAPQTASASTERNGVSREALALSHLSSGDTTGFWILWESHKGYLYGVCLKQMGGMREDAEDALSRAMLKAWDRLPRYAGEIANVKAWLTRLVCNLCLDIHRERRIRSRNVVNLDDAITGDSKSLAHDGASPEATVLGHEIYGQIKDVVDALPARLREPFELRFFEEMSYRDIAERLALTGDNVRKRIQLARAIMQERLGEYRTATTHIT
jgi:RNA polymerase sigma-70 factor (ECF subfamily)